MQNIRVMSPSNAYSESRTGSLYALGNGSHGAERTMTNEGLKDRIIFDLEYKYEDLAKKVYECYEEFMKQDIFDKVKQYKLAQPASEKEEKKKIDGETALQYLKLLVTKVVGLLKVTNEISHKIERESPKSSYELENLLQKLENEVKEGLKNQEKLKLHFDIAGMKIAEYEKSLDSLDSKFRKLQTESQKEIRRLREIIKTQVDQIKNLKEDSVISNTKNQKMHVESGIGKLDNSTVVYEPTKPQTNNNSTITSNRNSSAKKKSNHVESRFKVAQSLIGPEKFKNIQNKIDHNRIFNSKSKEELNQIRRGVDLEEHKEMTQKQSEILIARLKIQVEEKEKELKKLEKDYEIIFKEMKALKEKQMEEEKSKWAKEALSEKNPNLIQLYEDKIAKKDASIHELEKKLRKYAVAEKKIFVREKAFELERADYHDRLTYLHDRVQKLGKANENLSKTQQFGATMAYDHMKKSFLTIIERLSKITSNIEDLNKSDSNSDSPSNGYRGSMTPLNGEHATPADGFSKTVNQMVSHRGSLMRSQTSKLKIK